MMRVADRDGQRVGGVLALRIGLRQQHADHHADLRLLAVAGADHGLLHHVGRVFGDRQARPCAGTSMAMPRAWPSLSVAAALALTKVASTAASCGRVSLDHRGQPVMDDHQPRAEIAPARWSPPSRRRRKSAGCRRPRSGPSRCGGARDRCRGCESDAPPWPVDSPARALGLDGMAAMPAIARPQQPAC